MNPFKKQVLLTAVFILMTATAVFSQAIQMQEQGLPRSAEILQQHMAQLPVPVILANPQPALLQVLKQKWLSSAWQDAQKTTYSYNAQGALKEEISQKYDANHGWQNDTKVTYVFDTNQNLTVMSMYNWKNGQWDGFVKSEAKYNADNNITETTTYKMESGVWQRFMKSTSTYNSDKLPEQSKMQMWMNNAWMDFMRTSYSYDAQNNRVEDLSEMWMGINWNKTERVTYRYDSNGNEIEVIHQMWNNTDWENQTKTTTEYDANGNETKEIHFNWNGSSWEKEKQFLTSTNSNGQKTEYQTQVWNNNAWQNTYHTLSEYDANGNLTNETGQAWDNSTWVNVERSLYTYGNATGVREKALASTVPADFALANYPNPFNPETRIQFELPARTQVHLALYDSRGQLIRVLISGVTLSAGSHSSVWDGKDAAGQTAASGLYFYRLRAGSHMSVGKCTLLR